MASIALHQPVNIRIGISLINPKTSASNVPFFAEDDLAVRRCFQDT